MPPAIHHHCTTSHAHAHADTLYSPNPLSKLSSNASISLCQNSCIHTTLPKQTKLLRQLPPPRPAKHQHPQLKRRCATRRSGAPKFRRDYHKVRTPHNINVSQHAKSSMSHPTSANDHITMTKIGMPPLHHAAIYFERRAGTNCQLHALNNLLGFKLASPRILHAFIAYKMATA
eukprot:1139844-Pelagomonas_calceolata.AAC.2